MANIYPYPASLNVANFVSLKLNANNYLLWKTQILALIESQEMFGFLDGEFPMPEPTFIDTTVRDGPTEVPNKAFISWRRSDRLLRGWITGTLSEDVLSLVVGFNTSCDVWTTLETAFAQNSQEREFNLTHQLSSIKKGNDSLSEYLRKFKSICDDLAAIGKIISDKNKSYWMLQGLGPQYESFVTTMMKPPVPSYSEVIQLLQSFEARYPFHNPESPPQVSFYAHKTNNGGSYKKKGNGWNNFNSKGKGFYSNGNRNSTTSHFDADHGCNESKNQSGQMRISKLHDGKISCQICGKNNHTALECYHLFNHAYQAKEIPQALAALNVEHVPDLEWFPDTGATAHMTENSGTEAQNKLLQMAERKEAYTP